MKGNSIISFDKILVYTQHFDVFYFFYVITLFFSVGPSTHKFFNSIRVLDLPPFLRLCALS
jgi:hypothetical protein